MLPTFGMRPEHIQMVSDNVTLVATQAAAAALPLMDEILGAKHAKVANIFRWILIIAAIFLLAIDQTEWRSEMLVGLLVPIIFFNLPHLLWNFFRGEWGHWIALIVVLGILYTPPVYIPGPTNLWISIILLIVVSPSPLVALRHNLWGPLLSLVVAIVLGVQHLSDRHHESGAQGAFTDSKRLPTTVAIFVVFLVPIYLFFAYLNWV
eukprot:jgi/Mesen1/5643/ME000286S04853